MIRLWCRFRSQGVQWPLRPGDEVEIRDENGLDVVGVLGADLVIDLLAHYLYGVRLQRLVSDRVEPQHIRKPLKKADVAPQALQESRRAKRKGRTLGMLLIIFLAACSEPEDVGVRLRRECTSIVRESKMDERGYTTEYAIQTCVERRGLHR